MALRRNNNQEVLSSVDNIYQTQSKWDRLKAYAHKRLPWWLKKYLIDTEISQYHVEHDPKENEETSPTKEEEIVLNALWAVEFYTPAHAEQLITSFEILGWNKPDDFGRSDNPKEWLERARSASSSGAWYNLGFLLPLNSKKSFVGTRSIKTKLPSDVEYGLAWMCNLTSSITCIVICFVFNDDYKQIYDSALRTEYKTDYKRHERGYSVFTPELLKRDKIVDLRSEIRGKAKSWFLKNLPGTYCNIDTDNKHFPTCEFVTLKGLEAFSDHSQWDDHQGRILRLLNMVHSWDTWSSDQIKGLKFSWPVIGSDKYAFHSCLVISNENLSNLDMKSYGGHNKKSYILMLNNTISELISRWACISLLSIHEERLFKIRDSQYYKSSNKKTLQFLTSTREIISSSHDISTFCRELIDITSRKLLLHYGGAGFSRPKSNILQAGKPIDLVENLRRILEQKSKRLLDIDRFIKDIIIQQSNILSASENIQLQKRVWWLTFVITLLTVLLAYDAFQDFEFSSSLKTIMIPFFDLGNE